MLETELMGLHSYKASKEFWMLWNPVPKTIPKYYEIVKEPMSLSDIRENIASLKYLNYAAFCYDLDLIVFNAQTFNGPGSAIAKKAWDVRKRLCEQLEAKRRILGIDKCPIRNLEEAIRKKFIYLGRSVPPPPDRPHAPPPELPPAKALPPKPVVLPKGFAEFSYAAAANLSPSPPHAGGTLSPAGGNASPEYTGPAPLTSLTIKQAPSVSFGADGVPVEDSSGAMVAVAGVGTDTFTGSAVGVSESASSASLSGLSTAVGMPRTASFAPHIAGPAPAPAPAPAPGVERVSSLPPPMEGGGMHPTQSSASLARSAGSTDTATEEGADLSSAGGAADAVTISSADTALGSASAGVAMVMGGRVMSQSSLLGSVGASVGMTGGSDEVASDTDRGTDDAGDASPDAAYTTAGASPPGLYLDDGANSSPSRTEGAASPSMLSDDGDPMILHGGGA